MKKIIILLLIIVVAIVIYLARKTDQPDSNMDVYIESEPMETREVEQESYLDAKAEAEQQSFRPNSFVEPVVSEE